MSETNPEPLLEGQRVFKGVAGSYNAMELPEWGEE